jgi:hypothetical protein
VLVESALEHVDLAVVAADLLVNAEPAAQGGDGLLVEGVVTQEPPAQHQRACLHEQQADQIHQAGAPGIQLADPWEMVEGIQAAGVVDHLQDAQVAAGQLGDDVELGPLQADHPDRGAGPDAQRPVVQPVELQTVGAVAAQCRGHREVGVGWRPIDQLNGFPLGKPVDGPAHHEDVGLWNSAASTVSSPSGSAVGSTVRDCASRSIRSRPR